MFNLLKSSGIFKTIKFLVIALFFIVIFLAFLRVKLWDYDFWWHIATGKYIVSTGSLPGKDPFSYTSALEENKNQFPERERFILKQYWLSQIIFYLIYEYTGPKGIIFLRAIILITTLLLVFWRLQKWQTSYPISFIFIFTLFSLLLNSTGERPVLFTIFFSSLIFFILEGFKNKKDKRIFLLAPVMLLWANMHGGFILGAAIIMIFMLGEGVKIILKKTAYTKHEIILFYSATIVALGFSFINPTGWYALVITFSSKYKPFIQGIQEYASPYYLYKEQISPVNYWYLFMAVSFLFVLIVRNKKIDLTHILLLSGLLIMSFSAIRFIIYYALIASMVIGKESDLMLKDLLRRRFSDRVYKKILEVLTIAALISAVLYMGGIHKFDRLRFDIARDYSIPKGAVDFIEENRLSGNMFNDYGYGGYIAWRLYPWQKTFIDSRGLNITSMTEYQWIMEAVDYSDFSGSVEASLASIPLWERFLDHYNINFMLLSLSDIYADVHTAIFKLTESDKWVPVYCDPISIVFLRNSKQNEDIIEKYKLSEEMVYNILIYQSANSAINNKVNPRALMSLGKTFYEMGRLNDALKAYKYALNRMPENSTIQEKINEIEAEMKDKKSGLEEKKKTDK